MNAGGVAARLRAVRERIARAAVEAGRSADDVTLVGVSKRQPVERIEEAVAAGLEHVAESFAQEARDKLPVLLARLDGAGLARPRLHFVGRIQTNKVRYLVPAFDEVESVDRIEVAAALARRAEAHGLRLPILLQVNVSGEPQKGGVAPEGAAALLDACRGLALDVRGLMTVPEAVAPEARRASFAALRTLRDTLAGAEPGALPELSMGMSDDYPEAIHEGATRVRIGTALFGPREAA